MAKLVVYVCREPDHEKLVEMVKEVLGRVKGKKPKLQVIKLKLERSEDFPAYLSQLEDLFGGVATAEFRKYRIESLPAIVFNNQLVLQGSVPSLDELEEALAYAGLKFSKERAVAAQLPAQPQLLHPIQGVKLTSTPAQLATAKSGDETQARKVPQPPPRIRIVDRISQPIEEEKMVKVEESASSDATISQPTKPQEPLLRPILKPAPQETPVKAVQPPERLPPPPRTTPPPPLETQITQDELLINVPPAAPASLQARRRKLCRDCMFYEPTARRCLLYRAPINDPEKPICA
ncbi:MAG: hypothetical protein QXW23_01410 [Thermofilaceae archaeon]